MTLRHRVTWRCAMLLVSVLLVAPAVTDAAEQDLHAGLAHLRAGDQARAEHDLVKYRDGERNVEIRTSIDRVLPLLRRPMTEEMREYVAKTIEERVQRGRERRSGSLRASSASRMFPVFP